MSLPLQQARGIFYKTYLQAFREMIPVPSFLRSFLTKTTTASKTIGIEVERGTERIAVDVLRGTNGNRNKFSLSTEKEYLPPMYNENFDATMLDRYDRVFGEDITSTPPAILGYLGKDVAERLSTLRKKIERAYEKQAAQMFETGIITLNNGDNIDFKRQATSLVDLGSDGYWTNTDADVETQLIAAANFIRQQGKNGTPEFNLVMPGVAWTSLKKTDFFKDNANYQKVQLLDINMPQATAFGAAYHGRIVAGAYIFNVWTYDEVYESATDGTITRYLTATKAFVVPVAGTRFNLSFAGIPAIIKDKTRAEFSEFIASIGADYYTNDYIDPAGKSHIFEIMSAGVAIPVTVDMIYTMQIIGTGNPIVG